MATGNPFKLLIYMCKVAEGVGFEPTEVFTFAGFQGERLQTLYI